MAVKKKVAQNKARDAAGAARPYLQRLIDDEDLRDDLHDAYFAARDAYDRASNGKSPQKVLEDKKLHKDLRKASESLRNASEALREPEKKRKGGGFGKLLLVALIGAVLALALSEDLRKTLLDKLFGAEEEFEYSSTTAPANEPSATG